MEFCGKGLRIAHVNPGSPAFKAGLRKGDIVVSVDGNRVSDGLEFGFFSAQPSMNILTVRDNTKINRHMLRPTSKPTGVSFSSEPIIKCGNKCIFCFIDQMPRGLRQSLYVKDEDYRHSFTNGNYITLSHTSFSRLRRIAELGLSPLYVSVHATNSSIRNKMLGNSRAFDIMSQLRFLKRHDIRFHTQIVVCPGINNGRVLKQTIDDLLTLNDGLLSIAVVPVGLTKHRSIPLVGVDEQTAKHICREVASISDRCVKKDGVRRIFCADELFIKAKLPIPPLKYYEDFPQIENGVGLVRQLMEDWRHVKSRLNSRKENAKRARGQYPSQSDKSSYLGIEHASRADHSATDSQRYLVVTSQSAYRYVQSIFNELQQLLSTVEIDVVAIGNLFFGETVTVAGLMTAHDIIKTTKDRNIKYHCVFLPKVMFNIQGYTLDGFSKRRIEKSLGFRVRIISDMNEVVHALGYK